MRNNNLIKKDLNYISNHASENEAQAKIDKIIEAFEKHQKFYRIEANVALTSDHIIEEVRGIYQE